MATATTPTPDPILDTQVFWMKHKNEIVVGIVVMLLAMAVYGAYRLVSAQRAAAAATMLANATTAADYQKVLEEYPGFGAGATAALLLAAEQRKEQKFAEANATLQAFVDKQPKHQLVTTAKMAMAANFDSLGKPDEALETYRRIAADYPKSFNAPLALLSQVPLLKHKGQIEEARRVCETIMTQYRESFASTEASRYLKSLKLPPSAAAPPSPTEPQEPAAAANGAASVPPTVTGPDASVAPTP